MGQSTTTLSAAEKKAIKERAAELRASQKKEKLEEAVLEKIAEMPEEEQKLAMQVHEIVREVAPDLTAKTWYGMPAYARDGKIVCFFQSADKFKARYATLGFNDHANLDDGAMWPTAFALRELTTAGEARIAELVKKAAG